MSRKPTHKLGADETRDAIWALIRAERSVTVSGIWAELRLGKDTIRDYLIGLTAAGHLQKEMIPSSRPGTLKAVYTLVNDCGVDAPRVRRDGTAITMGQGRVQMWNTMRVLKDFSFRDLAFHASTDACPVSESDAKHYVRYLSAAGYLATVTPGRPGTLARYSLMTRSWTGPRPPQIQRLRQLYDPNLKKVVWSELDEHGGAE